MRSIEVDEQPLAAAASPRKEDEAEPVREMVDAVYRTIASLTQTQSKLDAYLVQGITGGTDAMGEVTVKVEEAGKKVTGHGADTDIIVASAKAYVNALNKLEYWKRGRTKNS